MPIFRPVSSGRALDFEGTPPAPPLNRKYLRAFHDYIPTKADVSSSTGATSVTATLQAGDLILVHLTHANGWADGTVLSTGARGWLPTNYCEVYDQEYARPLLHALTRLWNTLMSNGEDYAWTDEQQNQLQPLIAGVRYLLVSVELYTICKMDRIS